MKKLLKPLPKKAENVYYSDVNIYLNGKLTNKTKTPLFFDNTVYIPISTLNTIQKNKMYIDGKNIFIGTPPSTKEPINEVCPPCSLVNSKLADRFFFDGKQYSNVILFDTNKEKIHSEMLYKLNGLYKKMSFELIKINDVANEDAYFCIMADINSIVSVKLADLEKTARFELCLKNVDFLRFLFVSPDRNIKFFISNIYTE